MTTAQQPTTVYLAGPMFSAGDKSEQCALADALEQDGFGCYVPHINGIEVAAVLQLLNKPALHEGTMLEPPALDRCTAWVTRAVVALDVYQSVEGCQCTVLNLDGRVPDEGSLVEATAAWYAGHPVVPYKTTPITELGGHDNPMIGALGGWVAVPSDPASVVRAVRAALSDTRVSAPRPPVVQRLVDLGREISAIRDRPPLDEAGRASAGATLQGLPADQMALLEPDAALQDMCRQIVLAVVEFSKLGPDDVDKQEEIFRDGIKALQTWAAQPDVRTVLVDAPLSF